MAELFSALPRVTPDILPHELDFGRRENYCVFSSRASTTRRSVVVTTPIRMCRVVSPIKTGAHLEKSCTLINMGDFLLALGVKDIARSKDTLCGYMFDNGSTVSFLNWDATPKEAANYRPAECGETMDARSAMKMLEAVKENAKPTLSRFATCVYRSIIQQATADNAS